MNELILGLGGLIVGIIAVVLGGGGFWAIPLWEILFPGIRLGVLIGNLKVGSAFRGLASSFTTWKQVDARRVFTLSVPLLIGTVVGASLISKLDQRWTIVGVVLAAIVSEAADWLSARTTKAHFVLGAIALGAYYGFFGAGAGILIVALLRVRTPNDTKIAGVKSEARVIEFLMSLIAVAAHFMSGNIVNSLWIPWSIGAVVGGLLGGVILNKLGKLSGDVQKWVLRASYCLAIAVCIWTWFR
jgi:uncharacterized membrane protein YfcA